MSLLEIVSFVVSASQPLCVGAVAYLGLVRSVSSSSILNTLGSSSDSLASFRFYECATYSSLTSAFVYPISFVAVLCAYIVYDVDLSLFLCELLLLGDAGFLEYFTLIVLVFFTVAGLVYDYNVCGYGWDLS